MPVLRRFEGMVKTYAPRLYRGAMTRKRIRHHYAT